MKATAFLRRSGVFSDYYVQKYTATHSQTEHDSSDLTQQAESTTVLGGVGEGSGWNGLERRRSHDRRQQARRQQRGGTMLDTRTQSDRRRMGRRRTDALYPSFVACKI